MRYNIENKVKAGIFCGSQQPVVEGYDTSVNLEQFWY